VTRPLAAVCALLLTVLAACTAAPGGPAQEAAHGRVDVDTAALRHLKTSAGVEPCRPETSSSRLPRTTLPCLGGGKSVDLHGLKGPLVINLFAQWCGPCRSELPYYQQLHRKAKGTLRVLGVDYLDTQPRAALELVEQTGVTYPLLADPAGDLRVPFRVRFLPGIVFVDADGHVSVLYRDFRSYAELRHLVQQQLHVRIPA
jgi:thiol-disulfide isomerase/thioredoxin